MKLIPKANRSESVDRIVYLGWDHSTVLLNWPTSNFSNFQLVLIGIGHKSTTNRKGSNIEPLRWRLPQVWLVVVFHISSRDKSRQSAIRNNGNAVNSDIWISNTVLLLSPLIHKKQLPIGHLTAVCYLGNASYRLIYPQVPVIILITFIYDINQTVQHQLLSEIRFNYHASP